MHDVLHANTKHGHDWVRPTWRTVARDNVDVPHRVGRLGFAFADGDTLVWPWYPTTTSVHLAIYYSNGDVRSSCQRSSAAICCA